MYAWRNLQGKTIVAAVMKLRAQQTVEPNKEASKKLTPTKATSPKLHSV